VTGDDLRARWQRFRALPFPEEARDDALEDLDLDELDGSLAGCIEVYIEQGSLDSTRVYILSTSASQLERALRRIPPPARDYFELLVGLARDTLEAFARR